MYNSGIFAFKSNIELYLIFDFSVFDQKLNIGKVIIRISNLYKDKILFLISKENEYIIGGNFVLLYAKVNEAGSFAGQINMAGLCSINSSKLMGLNAAAEPYVKFKTPLSRE